MSHNAQAVAILLGLLLSFALMVISLFADRVTSFRIKNKNGDLVEVSRPRYATWLATIGTLLGFIGLMASVVAMFAYRNR